jgi:uncharacterized membrane protein
VTLGLQPFAEAAVALVEAIGIGVIVAFVIYVPLRALVELARHHAGPTLVRDARRRLARGILLGLEFLIAADIIHTVTIDLTFTTVGVLAIVVAIRTFLSYSLEVELDGRWPWQSERASTSSPKPAP